MDKEIARSLISLAVDMDKIIVSMLAEVEKISDSETKQKYDKAAGDLTGHIARYIIFPLVDMYPDLDPDK